MQIAPEKGDAIVYRAESPDEEALVTAAGQAGFQFLPGSPTSMSKIRDPGGNVTTYKILGINAFTSSRRRMSVVLQRPDNTTFIVVKGADSEILSRLHDDYSTSPKLVDELANINAALSRASARGLVRHHSHFHLRAFRWNLRVTELITTFEFELVSYPQACRPVILPSPLHPYPHSPLPPPRTHS